MMTNGTSIINVTRLGAVAPFVAILVTILSFAGCSKPADPSSVPAATGSSEALPEATNPSVAEAGEPIASEANMSTEATALLGDIEAAADIFEWYDVYTRARALEPRVAELDAALEKKRVTLMRGAPAIPISDAIELAGFKWKLQGAESSEGKFETFSASWLFHKKSEITFEKNEDVKLILRGWLDESHMHYFAPDKGGDPRYFEYNWSLRPSINQWETGEYHLVTRETYKQVPNVPYRIHTFFTSVKQDEAGDWKSQGAYGERLDLGWHADLGE